MTQFSLEKYLENPSRKVVTRSGHNVRILCTDQRGNMPIVALVEFETLDGVQIFYSDGKNESHREYDLFFADEEKELTEFEKAIKKLIESCCNEVEEANITNAGAKEISSHILDLARKEVEKEITKEVEQKIINHTYAYQNGYENGKYDALKDLPKWKKAKKDEELDCHVAIQQDDRVVLSDFVQKDEYYITLDVLKKLPKEE